MHVQMCVGVHLYAVLIVIRTSLQYIYFFGGVNEGPVATTKTKYNNEGFANCQIFADIGVTEKYCNLLSDAVNLSLANNTKSQYKTAIRHIERIEADLKIDMSLPFTIGKTLNYVGYLLEERGCGHNTIAQYLSGVRMLHLCKGMDIAALRPPIVSLILKGREHWDNVQKTLNQKPERVPVTIKVLKFIKRAINIENWTKEKKLRICI